MITVAHVSGILTGKRRKVTLEKAAPRPKPEPTPKVERPCVAPYTASVYAITHIATGMVYIGMSRNPRQRLNAHRWNLRRGAHINPRLQALWQEGAFSFEVVETGIDAVFIHAREQFWIWRHEDRLLNVTAHACPDMAPGARSKLKRGFIPNN